MVATQDHTRESVARTKLRVLLVDDDHDDSILFERCAERLEDFELEVNWTNEYADALRLVRSGSFDVHFIDFRLGHESGMELLSRILELDPQKIVVVLTGFGDDTIAAECRRRGARDYLSKAALNPDSLTKCLRTCSGGTPKKRPAEAALFDELHGVYRLEIFQSAARQAIEAEKGSRGHQAVLIVDVDNYDGLVKTQGEPAGRRAMHALSSATHQCLRHSDMVGRYGPDKLCVLTQAYESWMAAELAEQIRAGVERNAGVTTSIGVAYAPCSSAAVETLLARADAAKAAAQGKGRNCVEIVSMSMRLPSVPDVEETQ